MAQSHVAKAKEIARTLTIRLPEDKAKVDALTVELDQTQAALSEAEGARVSLDEQLVTQTRLANNVSDAYRSCQVTTDSLKVSRHRWVKLAWLFAGTTVLAAAWIFKKPLLMLGA